MRVIKDGAFAAAALESELSRAVQIDARDRALATELVYGTLRTLPWLEDEVGRHAARGAGSMDPRTKVELCLAAYQLFFLERVPAFAAVSETVSAVRRVKGDKVASFANAVLRKVAAGAELVRARAVDREVRLAEAVFASLAPWLRGALGRALGEDLRPFVMSGRATPPIALRVEDPSQRAAWVARLVSAVNGASFEEGKVSPRAILVRGAGKPQSMPGYAEGAWSVQEEGSQLVALALGARPGERVLDACAGRGNKTSLIAGCGARVDAADLHPAKLDVLTKELSRLGHAPNATFAVDWSLGSGDCTGLYDRVLVDAPCSGVGTLRRRPELQTRRTAEDLAGLQALQRTIATRAAEHVRPGGRLVYAVCSVLREEAEEVVLGVLSGCPTLEACPFDAPDAAALADGQSSFRLLPHVHGTDGYFLASLRKKC